VGIIQLFSAKHASVSNSNNGILARMTHTLIQPSTDVYPLADEQIEAYRRDGFIALPDVFVGDELKTLRDAVAGAVAKEHQPAPELNPDGTPRTKGAYEQLF